MDEEVLDELKEQASEPIEVKVKKEETPKEPSFDYDDYSPSDSEILDIEKEIQEHIVKRTKQNG